MWRVSYFSLMGIYLQPTHHFPCGFTVEFILVTLGRIHSNCERIVNFIDSQHRGPYVLASLG